MKFDLPEAEVKLIDGKLVQLPAKRFIGLMDYVEDLEAKLLSAEVHLREAERVGTEMERFAAARKSQQELSPEALKNVQKIVDEFTSPEKLKAAGQQRGISMRRLSMITAIPARDLIPLSMDAQETARCRSRSQDSECHLWRRTGGEELIQSR